MIKKSVRKQFQDFEIIIDFLMVAMLVLFASYYAYDRFMHSPPYVDPVRYPVRGIDVSAHNGMMNLDAAAQDGIEFVFIKASEGETFRDSNFRINYGKARHAGLKIGAYHYFRFDKDGIAQAHNLLEAIDGRELDLGIAIDVEAWNNAGDVPIDVIAERLVRMVDYLTLRGYRVMFYTNRDGYYDYLTENFRGYPLWICSFSEIPINAEWTFWQYNHRGKVAGIRGNVDVNAFCGSRDEWERYLATGRIQ